jgi:hypothetical protein
MWKPDICVYHGGCDDGFGAAWVVRRKFGESVDFVPAGYGKPIAWRADIHDKNILFVDFSLKREQMIELANGGIVGVIPKSIVILDHHKTAEAELQQWNIGPVHSLSYKRTEENIALAVMEQAYPIVAHFDMQSSGARMAWDFFNETEHNGAAPEMITYIEDRDLWRFSFGELTRRFSAALRTYPHDFETWDVLARDADMLINEGGSILRGHQKNIEQMCEHAYWGEVANLRVPMVNVPYHYASDIANALLAKFPDAPFAAAWFQRGDGRRQFSLRSENSRMDVSEVAKIYGGGGHRNAAGFQVAA